MLKQGGLKNRTRSCCRSRRRPGSDRGYVAARDSLGARQGASAPSMSQTCNNDCNVGFIESYGLILYGKLRHVTVFVHMRDLRPGVSNVRAHTCQFLFMKITLAKRAVGQR